MSRGIRVAVISQLITALYLQAVEWIDLSPWNRVGDVNQQATFDLALLVIAAAIVWAFVGRHLLLMIFGWSFYAVWLWLQVSGWWKPYLFGGRHVGPDWWFARTYKFLPPIGDRPVPDANHVVLQLLILVVLMTSGAAIISFISARRGKAR